MLKAKGISYKQQSFEEDSSEDELPLASNTPRNSEQLDLSSTHPLNHVVEPSKFRAVENSGGPNPEDCCCSPRCFTQRCAVASTILTFVVFAILVLILDLGIHEAEIIGHRRPYIYSYSRNLTLVGFELRGTSSEYKEFEVIPWHEREQLSYIELEYVDVEVKRLMETFASSYSLQNLNNLTLKNVKFKGVMPWEETRRKYPPKSFQNLHIEYDGPVGRDYGFTLDLCDTCVGDGLLPNVTKTNMSTIRTRDCLEHFLFFQRPDQYNGNLANLNYNIYVSMWGWTLLNLNNDTRDLTSTIHFSDQLVRNTTISKRYSEPGLKSLRLLAVTLNVSTLLELTSSLEVLQLDNVNIVGLAEGQRLSSVISKFSKLEELTLKGPYDVHTGVIYRTKYQILLDDLPGSLKCLTLGFLQLDLKPNSTANFHLRELNLYEVGILNDGLIDNFPKHFKVSNIAWRLEDENGTETKATSWAAILNATARANPDSIFLDNMFSGSSINMFRNLPRGTIEMLVRMGMHPPNFVSENKATMIKKTSSHLSFMEQSGGRLNIEPVQKPFSLWYKLLRHRAFVDERYG